VRAKLVALLIAVCLLVAAVCACFLLRDADPYVFSAGEDASPRSILKTMHRALLDGDKDRYLACFIGDHKYLTAAEAAFEFQQAGMAFRKAFVATYSEKGWERFNDLNDRDGATIELFPEEESIFDQAEIEVKGAVARCVLPTGDPERANSRQIMRVRRKGKGWRIDARDFGARDPRPEAKAALLFRVAGIIRRRTHDI